MRQPCRSAPLDAPPCPGFRPGLILLATVVLGCSHPPHLDAQRPTDDRLPGPVMLKRVAEAVEGERSGARVYVVASYRPTFPVLGVFDNPKEAEARAAAAGPDAAVFGPYQTIEDGSAPFAVACIHLKSSVMSTDRCVPPARPVLPRDITGMTLIVTRAGGGRDSIPIPAGADAIFLGMPAIDKFVIPYYARILGLPATAELRSDFVRAYGKR